MTPRARKENSRFEPTGHAGIVRDRRSGRLWLRATVTTDDLQSVFVDRSLKTKQIGEAIERAKKIRVQITQGGRVAGARHTFREAFDLLLKIQSTKSGGTPAQAESIVAGHLAPWFDEHCPYLDQFVTGYESVWADYRLTAAGRKPPKGLETEAEIEAWLKSATPRKLEHDRRYLNMALKRAFKAGWIKKEFEQRDFELNEVSDSIGQYIEEDALRLLIQASKKWPKFYLQILLSSHMGLRISECLHLRKEEVDLKRGEINLDPRRIKTRRSREVPIPIMDEVLPHLADAVHAATGEFIFPAERHHIGGDTVVDLTRPQDDNRFHWHQVLEIVGIDVRWHDLRHTAITNALAAGMADFAVRKIFGVNEKTFRRIYAHVFPDIQKRFRSLYCGKFV